MNEDDVRLRLFKHLVQTVQALFGDGRERLARLHDVQVVIRLDAEDIEHLIEHFTVLCGNADDGLGVLVLFQCVYERRHLDGLRAGAENGHNLDFIHVCSSPPGAA